MTVPTLIVEVAFDDGPYVANPTWTPITQYVLSATTRRGRSSDFDDTFTSSATLVLNNNTRIFDPFNNAGTYYNKLTPRRQIRIRGTANGTTYGIFRGFINGFPVVWSGAGKESTVTISAFDILALCSSDLLNGDLAGIYTQSLDPVHYYRCSDPNGSDSIIDYVSGEDALTVTDDAIINDRRFTSAPSMGVGLHGSGANLTATYYDKGVTPVTPTTGSVTVCAWYAFPPNSLGSNLEIFNSVDVHYFQLNGLVGTNSNYIQVVGWKNSSNQRTCEVQKNVATTVPAHFAFTYDNSNDTIKIYVNGAEETVTVAGTVGTLTDIKIFPSNVVTIGYNSMQDVVMFDKLLTATEIENIYKFGAGSQTEDTNVRLQRLLDLTDIPSGPNGLQSIYETSFGVITGVPQPNTKIVDALMEVMRTEGGFLFVDKNGKLTAVNREYFKTNTKSATSQATIDDTGSNIPYSNQVSMWYDGDNIRNEITVEYGSNAQSTVSDATSISTYGKHTHNIRTQTSTATEATELAQHYLDYYSPLFPSVSTIEIGTNVTAAQWGTLLGLELLERITFKRTPVTGTAFQQDLSINSIELDMRPTNWVMKLNGTARYAPTAPTVSISSATSVAGTTATLNGTVSANFFTTNNIKFQYSTASDFATYTEAIATPSSTNGQNVSVSANITGLSYGTQYYFRLLATSTVGTSTSTSGTLTTTADVPTASVSPATNVAGTSATLNGTVSSNGASTTVKFQYSTASNFATYTEVTASQSPVSGSGVSVSAAITGISPSTTYYFRIVATNSAGTTTTSSESFATASPPTVTMSSTTNYNQSIATFNGTVSANGAVTTVIKFQISTDNSNWSDATGGTTISNTSSQSVSVYYNATGLSENTLYYVRLVATNDAGTTNSTSNSFTTWGIQVYERSTAGGTTFTIPTVTPTGGSEVAVSIYDIIVFGGGGGSAGFVAGGGGGYQSISSRSLSGSRSVTTSVGAGGAAVDYINGTNAVAGSASTISGDLTTVTAAGGGADSANNNIPPSSGNGNAGGSTSYGPDPDPNDKLGGNTAYGGAGGAGAVGGNGSATAYTCYGGNGGAGVSITSGGVTRAGGAGGGGSAFISYGSGANGSTGANNTYGSGGLGSAGQAGLIRFRYYAASALA